MPAERRIPQWQHAVAGCTAGVATVLALQPLDVIKTRMQVQDGINGAVPLYRGTVHAVRSILKEEGFRALYAGLTPALIGSGLAWGTYFLAYNAAKRRYQRGKDPAVKPSPLAHLASAAEAGVLVCFLTNPVWVVKTRLQLQRRVPPAAAGAAATNYRGFVDCLTSVARHEGVRGLYKGLLPSLFLVSHGAIQLAVYEELKSLARSSYSLSATRGAGEGGTHRAPNSAEIAACGALSKLVASVVTYPSQVVRSRLQQRPDAAGVVRYRGVLHAVRSAARREGLPGFYRGIVPNVLRVMPQSAITFLVYETVVAWLSTISPPTPVAHAQENGGKT